MQKRWLCLLAAVILAAACKKNNNASPNNLSFDLNGTHYDFDSVATNADSSTGAVIIDITAVNRKTKSSVVVGTQANLRSPLGTYHHSDDTTRILITFLVNIVNHDIISQYVVQGPVAFDFTITSAGSGIIKGNFSGQIPVITASNAPASLTNGAFDAPY